MSLIKKIDVQEHFAARRAMRLSAVRSTSQTGASGLSGAAPAGTKSKAPEFVEDFVLEHSGLNVAAAPVAVVLEFGRKQTPTALESSKP